MPGNSVSHEDGQADPQWLRRVAYLLCPGFLLHEAAHYLTALLSRGQPSLEDAQVRTHWPAGTPVWQVWCVHLAPTLIACVAALALSAGLVSLPSLPLHWWPYIIINIAVFSLPSRSDLDPVTW